MALCPHGPVVMAPTEFWPFVRFGQMVTGVLMAAVATASEGTVYKARPCAHACPRARSPVQMRAKSGRECARTYLHLRAHAADCADA